MLSGESCHWKVAVPHPVVGDTDNTVAPLTQMEAGAAVIEAAGDKIVTTVCAVFTQPVDTFVAVQVYVVITAVADFT